MTAMKPTRLQHPRLGAVSAGADRCAARRKTGAGLSGDRRSARTGAGNTLSADPARLPSGARCLPRQLNGDAAILPRIVALGDLDEDEIAFSEATGELAEAALALPPAIGPLERRLLLAQLIVRWAAAIRPDKARR